MYPRGLEQAVHGNDGSDTATPLRIREFPVRKNNHPLHASDISRVFQRVEENNHLMKHNHSYHNSVNPPGTDNFPWFDGMWFLSVLLTSC